MTAAGMLSLLCLIVTGGLASFAVFSHHYDDTLLQRMGLSIVAIGCIVRAGERLAFDVADPPPILLLSQLGLALYAVGTALKLWRARPRCERRHQKYERRGAAHGA